MSVTKIQFSPEEFELVCHQDLILTKNRIIKKVSEAFGELGHAMEKEWTNHSFPGNMITMRHKVSKGENFKGLPWVVLDFPREFGKDDVFAIRHLFWWANYFSITLQLKGKYKTRFADSLKNHLDLLRAKGFHISISTDEWAHNLDSEHYVQLSGLDEEATEKIIYEKSFVKLVAKISVSEWSLATDFLWQHFLLLLTVMEN